MILYHYCSNFAFHSVITQRRIRLSLLSQSNDAMEGRHIIDLVSRLLPDGFEHKDDALQILHSLISIQSAVGFCLSAKRDLLSQWRGYADDAQGVAIGFNKDALNTLADENIIILTRAHYNEKSLTDTIGPHVKTLVELYEKRKTTSRIEISDELEIQNILITLARHAYFAKAPFFEEEQEWRIFQVLVNASASQLDLPDCHFVPSHERLKLYRDFPPTGFAPSMIREVVLGPRNRTPVDVVRIFLDSRGFDHVSIGRSFGTYR